MLQRKRIPFVTVTIAAITIVIHTLSRAATLQYDRAAIAAGETWRLFTGHLTHWNTDHLFWDLLMFVVLGILIETQSKRTLAWLILGSASAISMFTWLLCPELATYRGLSGIDTTLFVFVACRYLFDAIGNRQWRQCMVPAVLLGSALGKFSYEALTGSTLFVDSQSAGFTVFLDAHLVGVAIGIMAALVPVFSRRHLRVEPSLWQGKYVSSDLQNDGMLHRGFRR